MTDEEDAIRALVKARLASRAQHGLEDVAAAADEAASLPRQLDTFRELLSPRDAPDGLRALLRPS
jgi:hypothetical protein